jgi:glycosyltransferase involved in cell wall biosynthesis
VFIRSWNLSAIEPLLWKRLLNRAAVMWAESTCFSGVFRGRVSNAARAFIVGQVDAFVSNGTQATRYLHELGIAPSCVVTSRLASPLADAAIAARAFAAPLGRETAGPRFLYVGRLIDRKRPLQLIDAFARVVSEVPAARLTVVGDGPLSAEVAQAAKRCENVSVLGRREGDALAAVYQDADILVIPSVREVWGLVVDEALAHGLYVIATDETSSALDLVDEASGTLVPADDPAALTRAMVSAARTLDREPAVRARRASQVAAHTTAAFAEDIFRAAELALQGGRAPAQPRRRRASA